jgi:hypothetical protein
VKALIIGSRGIGARHAENIAKLRPDTQFIAVGTSSNSATTHSKMDYVPSIETGLEQKPDISVIALPPTLQADAARQIIEAGIPLYIEKPPATDSSDLVKISKYADDHGIVTYCGFQLRRMPGFCQIRKLIQESTFGKIQKVELSVGQWLPDWRPDRDYRETYSAQAKMGGGVLLDLIHELDLARFLFGDVKVISCNAENTGTLEIDTEDTADIVLAGAEYKINVHLDYLDKNHHRKGRIQMENADITYDALTDDLTLTEKVDRTVSHLGRKNSFNSAAALADAMSHFLNCAEKKLASEQPLSDGLKSLLLSEQSRKLTGLVH